MVEGVVWVDGPRFTVVDGLEIGIQSVSAELDWTILKE